MSIRDAHPGMHVLFLTPSHRYSSCQQTKVQGEPPIGSQQHKVQDPELHNHHGPLVDPNTGEPYPMEVAGNFCLKDPLFPSCPGDSLFFHDSELTKLMGQGYCIPTYWKKATESTGSLKTHQFPTARRTLRSLLAKMRSPASLVARPQGHLHLGSPTPQAPAIPHVS